MPITEPCRWTFGFENGHFVHFEVEQPPQSQIRQRVATNKTTIFPFLGI
jgi:uncharacterized membrane protein